MKKRPDSAIKTIDRRFPVPGQMSARILFLFLWAADTVWSWFARQKPRHTVSCETLSIVIPTRNEEAFIKRCIQAVVGNPCVCEVIVVDAASHDRTQSLAQQAGARVLVHDRPIENGGGRGGQIKAGIDLAMGDVVAVVHADTLLPGTEIDRLMNVLNRCPDIIGGAVGCRFDAPHRRYRVIELANDLRAAILKISFGDQVQFFRRVPVVSRNLFPDMPIMEDVEFSIRLHRLGRRTFLFGNALASTRRWEKIGNKNAAWVIKNVAIFLLCRLVERPDTARVYQRYYGSGK